MVLTPEEQADIEERFEALEERNAKLERLIRSGKAFTINPLALATDLDDLGSVKTHLDFEEAPLTPVNPQPEVGRVFGVGRTGVNDTSLRYIDKDGNISEITHPPAVRVTNSATAAVNNNILTFHNFNTERFDTDNMHSTVSNTSRLTATTAGKYQISGHIRWASNATGRRQLRITAGGVTLIVVTEYDTNQNDSTFMSITTLLDMAVDDYVELGLFQTSGGSLNSVKLADSSPEFMAVWVAPS